MPDEKKIIIDEDWKAQVQAEKEEAAKVTAASAGEGQPGAATQEPREAMPPASLEILFTMLATEAMVALGQVAHPATGQLQADRAQAQYLIDLLDVLREKTKGNLTTREQQMLETLLHELRLAFVQGVGEKWSRGVAE